jgi:hypothetical protein
VTAINQAIDDYNDPTNSPENIPKITIEAVVGDGNNGGAANSIILRNTNAGDESRIIIDGLDSDPLLSEVKLGLTNGTYVADADHNTGELSLFSHKDSININAGIDDLYLDQLGLGGGSRSSTDEGGDGQLIFEATDNQVLFSMQGFDYSDELQTDGGSFKIWLYNNDDTLALPQAVEVSLERAYSLQDVAEAINISMINASGEATPWLNASVKDNKLVLTPITSLPLAATPQIFLPRQELTHFFPAPAPTPSVLMRSLNSMLSISQPGKSAPSVKYSGVTKPMPCLSRIFNAMNMCVSPGENPTPLTASITPWSAISV